MFYRLYSDRLLLQVPVILLLAGTHFRVAAESVDFLSPELETRVTRPIFPVSQIPNPIPPRTPEQPIPNLPPPDRDPLELPTPIPNAPETRPDIPGTIIIERFEFEGNTVFSSERLNQELAEFIGRPLAFAELLQAEAAVTQLYLDAGYINSGAVIPAEQTFEKERAVVKIRAIEGGVEAIEVTGTRRLNSNYVRKRLELATQPPLNRNRLLEALQLLQLDPRIENISAELSAGTSPEQSLLEVTVIEADAFDVEVFADNGRAPSVGSFRRGVSLEHNNLLGFGDRFSASYANTDGSNAYDVSYSVPVNARNGTLAIAAGFTDTEAIEPPFDRLDITGSSRYYELSFRQPIVQTPTQEFAFGLTASRQQSQTQLLGESFPLSPGADEDGETRISALRFFQEWTARSPEDVLVFRSQFSLGVGWFDATVNTDPPDSRFFSWRGQGQYVRRLGADTLLLLRSDVQLAPRSLVPLEQIGLGGLRSVRGYRQDVLLTDNGAFASAEVRLPIVRVEQIDGVLQVVPFIDLGVGWNSSGNENPDPNTAIGVGLGFQWQMGDRVSARLDWGFPLIEIDSRDRTWQENGLYFSINVSPF